MDLDIKKHILSMLDKYRFVQLSDMLVTKEQAERIAKKLNLELKILEHPIGGLFNYRFNRSKNA